MKITGSCHCGAISYEAEADPSAVTVCHCTDCQKLSGSAFRVVIPAKREDLKLRGEPKTYVKTAESGRRRVQAFCGNCGTPIYSAEVTKPRVFNLRVGTADQRADLPPKLQLWCRSALGWATRLETAARRQKQDP